MAGKYVISGAQVSSQLGRLKEGTATRWGTNVRSDRPRRGSIGGRRLLPVGVWGTARYGTSTLAGQTQHPEWSPFSQWFASLRHEWVVIRNAAYYSTRSSICNVWFSVIFILIFFYFFYFLYIHQYPHSVIRRWCVTLETWVSSHAKPLYSAVTYRVPVTTSYSVLFM